MVAESFAAGLFDHMATRGIETFRYTCGLFCGLAFAAYNEANPIYTPIGPAGPTVEAVAIYDAGGWYGTAFQAGIYQAVFGIAAIGSVARAPNTAGGASGLADDGVNVIPSSGRTFVGTPRGTVYDVPQGWAPRVADNGRGVVYQRPGAFRSADSILTLEPTSKYPCGYVRSYNSGNQPLDVFGSPGADPFTHIPQNYVGPWPGWPR